MYLICYGTRPELIKLIPLIKIFDENNINYITLFSGQHETLIEQFEDLYKNPTIKLTNIMEHNQSLNMLISKILISMDNVYKNYKNIKNVIIQGDTSTSYAISLSAFHYKKNIIHVEAGLRTFDKYSPFPEEMNRNMISRLSDIHLCPTERAVNNLLIEGITKNVYNVGNTIVDMYKYIIKEKPLQKDNFVYNLIKNIKFCDEEYILVTLHRRENRGDKINNMWKQLNYLSMNYFNYTDKKIKIIYIKHPSLQESKEILNKDIIILEPIDYISMVHLISNCCGIITDSGGIQEEAVCAGKKVLICRETTERQETIESGWGLLINTDILVNISFLLSNDNKKENILNNEKNSTNPYGENVCKKIISILD